MGGEGNLGAASRALGSGAASALGFVASAGGRRQGSGGQQGGSNPRHVRGRGGQCKDGHRRHRLLLCSALPCSVLLSDMRRRAHWHAAQAARGPGVSLRWVVRVLGGDEETRWWEGKRGNAFSRNKGTFGQSQGQPHARRAPAGRRARKVAGVWCPAAGGASRDAAAPAGSQKVRSALCRARFGWLAGSHTGGNTQARRGWGSQQGRPAAAKTVHETHLAAAGDPPAG